MFERGGGYAEMPGLRRLFRTFRARKARASTLSAGCASGSAPAGSRCTSTGCLISRRAARRIRRSVSITWASSASRFGASANRARSGWPFATGPVVL